MQARASMSSSWLICAEEGANNLNPWKPHLKLRKRLRFCRDRNLRTGDSLGHVGGVLDIHAYAESQFDERMRTRTSGVCRS